MDSPFVKAIEKADDAMQEAIRVAPEDFTEHEYAQLNQNFRMIRAALVGAYERERASA